MCEEIIKEVGSVIYMICCVIMLYLYLKVNK